MDNFLRPEAHEIDTLARRKVPLSFPDSWENREMTGTDYGIDMIIEIFKDGCATGSQLSLQIKGTKTPIFAGENVLFDMPVNTLKYSEMFITPVLLALCPVDNCANGFYYLWLQEYIKIVLDQDSPNWRNNKTTVRVRIPSGNYMPGDETKLAFISDFPKRIFDWCQYAKICEDMKYRLDSFYNWDDIINNEECVEAPDLTNKHYMEEDLEAIIKLIEEMIALKGIFGDVEWLSPQAVLNNIIMPALNSAKELYSSSCSDRNAAKVKLSMINSASALLSIYNDYSFSRFLWTEDGEHNF